jgi:hypothetical protein
VPKVILLLVLHFNLEARIEHEIEQLPQSIMLWICILEVPCSDLGWDTAYPDGDFFLFSLFPQDKCRECTSD